jgi:hypothetical protein
MTCTHLTSKRENSKFNKGRNKKKKTKGDNRIQSKEPTYPSHHICVTQTFKWKKEEKKSHCGLCHLNLKSILRQKKNYQKTQIFHHAKI